ncbi:MAG: VOC family protein [Rhodospirillales bacterium]
MNKGLPGLAGVDHVAFTVPDLEEATRFFVEVIGCKLIFEIGPFIAEDDWMAVHLGVHPRAVIRKLRYLTCRRGPALELFEYEAPDQAEVLPRNSDHGGHHLAFYVEDMEAAVAHLRQAGVEMQGEPTVMGEGPSGGLTWLYFKAPWGLQLELVCYPKGLACEAEAGVTLWSPRKSAI